MIAIVLRRLYRALVYWSCLSGTDLKSERLGRFWRIFVEISSKKFWKFEELPVLLAFRPLVGDAIRLK